MTRRSGSISTHQHERALKKAFKEGVKCAAAVAEGYNALSFHEFRLGDCILAKLNVRKGKPRRNPRTLLHVTTCKRTLLGMKPDLEALMQIAAALEPDAWAEYVRKRGVVANLIGYKCLDSVRYAKQLLAAGYRDCVHSRAALPAIMLEALAPSRKRTRSVTRTRRSGQ